MTMTEPTPYRQPGLYLDVTFQVAAPPPFGYLDDWLGTVLEIPICPPPSQAGDAASWLWRVLLLAREWMLAGRIPVFDPPEIVFISANPCADSHWNAKIRMPLVEHVPQALYIEMLNRAFRLSAWAAANPSSPENRNTFFADITSLADERLPAAASRGKSTLQVLRAAHQMGIPFLHLGGGVFQLGWGKNARRIDRSVTGGDSAIGASLAQQKSLTAMLLRAAGLPAPVHELVMTADQALSAARRLGWPVVVKPAALDRGEGVTIDVADEATLRQAFETATKAAAARAAPGAPAPGGPAPGGPAPGRQVIIERQVPGICDRLFVAHGALLYAVRRWPMDVRGDGIHTVAELVANEVAAQQLRPPWKRQDITPLDEPALRAIAWAGYCASAVPASGAVIPLRKIETAEGGGLPEDVTSAVHPENVAIALRAAELLGLQVAGIDVITTDISKPWFETGAIINEVNFSPMLGASEISRHKIPIFLQRLMAGNGRIPVHVYVGGDLAWRAATQHWRKLTAGGEAAFLTSAMKTFSPSGKPWPMPFDDVALRARALVLSAEVGAIILAAQPDELRHSPLPFDTVDSLTRVDTDVAATVPEPDGRGSAAHPAPSRGPQPAWV